MGRNSTPSDLRSSSAFLPCVVLCWPLTQSIISPSCCLMEGADPDPCCWSLKGWELQCPWRRYLCLRSVCWLLWLLFIVALMKSHMSVLLEIAWCQVFSCIGFRSFSGVIGSYLRGGKGGSLIPGPGRTKARRASPASRLLQQTKKKGLAFARPFSILVPEGDSNNSITV